MISVMDAASTRRRRQVERVLERSEGLAPLELLDGFVRTLAETTDLTGACSHVADPQTGIPIASSRLGDPPGDFEQSLEFEYRRDDVMPYAELARRPQRIGVLSRETAGRPSTSPRFRELIEPAGGADELRASLTDGFGTWGIVTLWSPARFDDETVELVTGIAAALTAGVRRARVRSEPTPLAAHGSSVVILDAADRLQAADTTARARMADLAAWNGGPLPTTFYVLAAQARMRDPERPAHAQVPAASGAWFSLDAAPLDDERYGPVAIVLRPARREGVLDARLRAFGLSRREREVAELTVQGRSAKEIALELVLSRYTVQDHLKHIYEKTSVRSRGELSLLAAGRGVNRV